MVILRTPGNTNRTIMGFNDSRAVTTLDNVFIPVLGTPLSVPQGTIATVDSMMPSAGSTIRGITKFGVFSSANVVTWTFEINDADTTLVITATGVGLFQADGVHAWEIGDLIAWRMNHVNDAGTVTWRGQALYANVI